jgi:hypothetical protein
MILLAHFVAGGEGKAGWFWAESKAKIRKIVKLPG